MKYKYTLNCVSGETITFETTIDIDFHKVFNQSTTAIVFNDMYINMANVICIRKEEE